VFEARPTHGHHLIAQEMTMHHTVTDTRFPDEAPTRPSTHVPEAVLSRIERIRRLADEAVDLLASPIGPRVAQAVVTIRTIASIAREVLQ
jgi:hypothetical protein